MGFTKRGRLLVYVVGIMALLWPVYYVCSQTLNPYYKVPGYVKEMEADIQDIREAVSALLQVQHDDLDYEIAYQKWTDETTPLIKHSRVDKVAWLEQAESKLVFWAYHLDKLADTQ